MDELGVVRQRLRRRTRLLRERAKHSRWLGHVPGLTLWYRLDRPTAIVVPGTRVAYVPIPKVSSSSIKTAILSLLDDTPDNVHHGDFHTVRVTALATADIEFSFTVVRDPFDRLASCYREKIVGFRTQPGRPLDLWKYGSRFSLEMSFADFVRQVARIPDVSADPHFRSQHRFFVHRGRVLVDEIARLESLAEDWQRIRQRCDLPALPDVNRSGRPDHDDLWTPSLARLAAKRYAEDITRFGYQEHADVLVGSG